MASKVDDKLQTLQRNHNVGNNREHDIKVVASGDIGSQSQAITTEQHGWEVLNDAHRLLTAKSV